MSSKALGEAWEVKHGVCMKRNDSVRMYITDPSFVQLWWTNESCNGTTYINISFSSHDRNKFSKHMPTLLWNVFHSLRVFILF